MAPVSYGYDSHGLLSALTAGSGGASRATNVVYNAARELTTVTDTLGRSMNFAHDLAGRPITQTLPDGRAIGYAYDASGNLSGLTPPGRPLHSFSYTAIDQIAQYSPPDVNPGSDQTQYSYNADRRLTLSTRPDGQTTTAGFDSAGRLNAVTIARGQFGYAYSPTTGNLTAVSAPGSIHLAFSYAGALLTGKSWSGPIAGDVGYIYDNRFRLTATSVNGGNAIGFQYDADSLLTQAGALALSRSPQNGLLTGSTLGSIADTWSTNEFAEAIAYSAKFNTTSLYKVHYARDKLGRIIRKTETISGATAVYSYTYDLAGRLTSVAQNGLAVESYTYDANSNRLSATGAEGIAYWRLRRPGSLDAIRRHNVCLHRRG